MEIAILKVILNQSGQLCLYDHHLQVWAFLLESITYSFQTTVYSKVKLKIITFNQTE